MIFYAQLDQANIFQTASSAHNCQLWKFWEPFNFKCKRASRLPFRATHCYHTSTPQLFKSSLLLCNALRISLERTVSLFIVLYFFCSLRALVFLYFYTYGLTSFVLYFYFLFCCSFNGTQAQSLFRDWVGEGNTWSKTCISSLCSKDWIGAPTPDQNHWVTIFRAVEDRVGEAISWSKIVRCTGILILVKALAGFCKETEHKSCKAELG